MLWGALLASISISAISIMLYRYFGKGGILEKNQHIRQRIASASSNESIEASQIKKRDNFSEFEILKKLLNQYSPFHKIAHTLKLLKFKISVSVFLLISILAFVFVWIIFKYFSNSFIAFAAAIISLFAPLYYLRVMRKRYIARFAEYLPNALSIISSSIKVGHGIEAALEAVAKTAPHPVCDEFQALMNEVQLGITLSTAMDNLYNRINSVELKIFVTGIGVNQELGGNLSELLDNLEKTIRDRFAILREVDTLSAQGRLSSWILMAVPFVVVGLYMWKNGAVFTDFVRSSYGQNVLMVCFVFQTVGFLGVRQIIKLRD